ncbi:unnamed protein product [Pylaiella littoralis]
MRHWMAPLHVLMYVRGTIDLGITFERGGDLDLVLYVDADFASKETGRKSVSGGLLMCAGACAGYFSKTQQSVTTATSEAECSAMAHLFKGDDFLAVCLEFCPSRQKCRMHGRVRGKRGSNVPGDQPRHYFQLEAHRRPSPLYP